jgi:hypothetical protein
MLRLHSFKIRAENIAMRNSDISFAEKERMRSTLNNSGGQVSAILDCWLLFWLCSLLPVSSFSSATFSLQRVTYRNSKSCLITR